MEVFWSEAGLHRASRFNLEAELEAAVVKLRAELFGPDRFYLNLKKKIGAKGGQRSIPDGYLLDLSSPKPRLFVVEVELCSHDPLRHIAVQLLQFSLAFESDSRMVRNALLQALEVDSPALGRAQGYAASHGYRSLDHMLDWLVSESDFAALVIIDSAPERLEAVLNRKLNFGVELLEVAPYTDPAGKAAYRFEPFLADVGPPIEERIGPEDSPRSGTVQPYELDTIVVPAREDGFVETFLGENRWYSVRIHASMREQLKYIAIYRVAPISAITHVGTIRSLEPWNDSGKWVINLAEPAREISPLSLVRYGRVKSLQSIRYANFKKLLSASDLDGVWS